MSLPGFLRFGLFSRFLCELNDREYRAKRIALFLRLLAGQKECLEFDSALFTSFVEKVIVGGKKEGCEADVCLYERKRMERVVSGQIGTACAHFTHLKIGNIRPARTAAMIGLPIMTIAHFSISVFRGM